MLHYSSHFCSSMLKLSNHPIWIDTKNQRFTSYSLSPFLLYWIILVVLTFPCSVHCIIYKVGVIGPWTCDPIFAKALPNVAAKLAVDQINKDSSLNLGNHFDYVILNEDCQTSKALDAFLGYSELASGFIGPTNPGYCDAASLLGKNWNRIVFSWACTNYELDDATNFPTFARTLPSPTRVLFTVMKYFQWAHVAIISSTEDIWVDTAAKVASALRKQGLPVGIVLPMGNEPGSVRKVLEKIKSVDKLHMIIMCMHSVLIGGGEQKHLLEVAHDLQMTDGSYVFIPYDALLYSLPYQNTPYPVLVNNSKLQKAYDSVLTITVDSTKMSFHQAFQKHVQNREIVTHLKPEQVSPLFGTIYNAIYFVAKAMNNNRKHRVWVSGSNIAKFSKNIRFDGFNQRIWTDENGDSFTDYVILDTDGRGTELYRTYIVDMEADLIRLTGRRIHFPNGVLPKPDSACWFTRGKICTGGIDPFFAVAVPLLIIFAMLFSVGLAYFIRRRIIKIKLMKGPDKILLTLDDVTFINPQLSRKKISAEDSQLSEGGQSTSDTRSRKSPMRSFSLRSLTPATHENSNVAVYEGDWVWLKKFPYEVFGDLKPGASAMFEMMKDLRHENINLFLGFFYDCGLLAIVTEFCIRGSLLDLLRNEDVKLDWMFKSSLLLDLIKGMRYLHHRECVHGNLKSRNCVVDGRFVLKVTDYGYNAVATAQHIPLVEPPAEDQSSKMLPFRLLTVILLTQLRISAEVLLYFATLSKEAEERSTVSEFHRRRHERMPVGVRNYPRLRVYRVRLNYEQLSEEECIRRLRFSKEVIGRLCEMLSPDLENLSQTRTALTVQMKVTTTLNFYANGSFQAITGDLVNISRSAARACIHQVTSAILRRCVHLINLDLTMQACRDRAAEFHALAGFPKILGAVDGTHVALKAFESEGAPVSYYNRKGYHSVNVMVICDAGLRILAVNCGNRGSNHDSYVLKNSVSMEDVLQLPEGTGWLIGDAGYALQPCLMTPFRNCRNPAQERYNRAHILTRQVIERCIGVLKSRFRCLHRSGGELQYRHRTVARIIIACCCLHNLAIKERSPGYLEAELVDIVEVGNDELPAAAFAGAAAAQARAVRDRLVERCFR